MNTRMAQTHVLALFALAVFALPVARAADPVLVEDQSMTMEQYKTVGFPDITRGWSVEDLKSAAKAMTQLGKTDPMYLPRAGSDRSGKLFAHMVSIDPLATIKKKTDTSQRIGDLTAAIQMLMAISRPYMNPPAGKFFDAEPALLAGSAARYTAAAMHEIAGLRTAGDDADYEKSMASMCKQLNVAIGLLKTGTTISLASRTQLIKDLDPVIRDAMPLLPATVQASLIKTLQDVIDEETDSDITKKERPLLDWMKRVAKK